MFYGTFDGAIALVKSCARSGDLKGEAFPAQLTFPIKGDLKGEVLQLLTNTGPLSIIFKTT